MNLICWLFGHLWETRWVPWGLPEQKESVVLCRRCGAWEKMR